MSGEGEFHKEIDVRNWLTFYLARAPLLDGYKEMAPNKHGPTSAIVVRHCDGAAQFAKGWTGSIQWIAQRPVRATNTKTRLKVQSVGTPQPCTNIPRIKI